ncbi:MAG: 1-acyl-sn-glycerol-3-phosphate acyltransferase, partial [Lachnospiraceae bacterium]|nr:1-acyl-sn-glycerol-3-phosphate acyltransferase [Lachnospiraceae bacterium]
MEAKKPKVKDHYLRHRILFAVIRPLGWLVSKITVNYSYKRVPPMSEPYILLANHCTDLDPILVALGMPGQAYFVASEHITRWKVFGLLKFVFDPIIRYKGTVGAGTVKEILKKVKEKKNVAFFPEGVRTMDGRTMPIVPATARLIQRSGHALVTYKLHGGYFTSPNWGESGLRRGKLWGEPVHIYSSQELKSMSLADLTRIIDEDLAEDAYVWQQEHRQAYKGKKLAEHLENILFICPDCGKVHTMASRGDRIFCTSCG